MSSARAIEFLVPAEQDGKRLDTSIVQHHGELSRSQVKSLIGKGLVTVDGAAPAKAGQPIRAGQLVQVAIPAPEKLDLMPRDVGIRILYEDEHLAVVEKPAGISVHPSHTERAPTVVHGLLHELGSLSSVGGVERPGIVHRIDKGTSGILVVSKTDAAHAGLGRQFKEHTIDRRYRALVYGDVRKTKTAAKGTIETFFGRNPSHRKKMTGKLKTGRKAITHWQVAEVFAGLTLIDCRLETGRTHQIRVHLSEMGFPLVGDPLYCDNERRARALAKVNPELARACAAVTHQLLHAYRLGFSHPLNAQLLVFEAPLPGDFSSVLELARG